MNFWNRHIGDIIRDTVSLTMLEDGAYTRLLDQYYQTERPLPLDKKMVYRLARATSATERKAVDFVLQTFFTPGPDGYHQKRCDAEIAAYSEKQRKAQASANARWNRSEGNANASNTASTKSVDNSEMHAPNADPNLVRRDSERNASASRSDATKTAESHVQREIAYANASSSHDASDMRTHSEGNAHQAPVTIHQTPEDKTEGTKQPVGEPLARARPAELTMAMRRHSVAAQPGDPRVVAAAESGVTVETIEGACLEAKQAKPGERINAGYVLTIAERWTREASTPRPPARASPPQTIHDKRAATIAALTGANRHASPEQPADAIDVAAKRIG